MSAYREAAANSNALDETAPTFDKPGGLTRCPGCGLRLTRVGRFFLGPHRFGFLWLRRCQIAAPHLHEICLSETSEGYGCGAAWTAPARGFIS